MSATVSGGGRIARPRSSDCRVGDWLSLAAAPTFATLALLGGDGTCGHAALGSGAGGMAVMYGLMALFHLSPWLRLLGRRDTE